MKKTVRKVKMADVNRNIIYKLLEKYDIETAEHIQCINKDFSRVRGNHLENNRN